MPELPEVETMVRGIRRAVEGRRIVQLRRCACKCRPIRITPGVRVLQRRCRGATIHAVRRLAKRVVLELDRGDRIAIEPRMTGLMVLSDPPTRSHLRLQWVLEGDARQPSLWFWDRRGLGTVSLYTAAEFDELCRSGRIGPDALSMRSADWRRLRERTRRPVKVALLDQKLVAGIGNIYASEILHRSGIGPGVSAAALSDSELTRLAAATREILRTAIRLEGSTLGDGTYRNALNQDGGYQNQHRVYGRQGQQCLTCRRAHIVRIVQAQRSTFFCPQCQSRDGS